MPRKSQSAPKAKTKVETKAKANWKDMLDEFRALGGIADNIELRTGSLGRGVFAIDPKSPTKISVPDNLLINVDDLVFENDKLRIKKDSKVPERERAFFEGYEEDFSWGAGGKKDTEDFFGRVDALPETVREVLVKNLSLAGLGEANEGPKRIRRRFLHSRMITYRDGKAIMPVLELANHGSKGCPFNIKSGVAIGGTFEDEVLAHYGMVDPFGAFEVWGFSSDEPVAFSLRSTVKLGSRQLVVQRILSSKKVHGKFRIPVLDAGKDKVTISHLMLGHARYPRLSKGIFYQFMKEIGEANAEELFDQVRRFNIQQFLKLMEALDGHEGELITTLRKLCRQQISAITHSIGTREI
jgi:hypothetical protein